MKVERKCKIVSKERLNHDAVYMVLEAGDMVRTSCKGPGQFVHIKCGDSLLLRRPISVCSCQEDEPRTWWPSPSRSGERVPSGWPTGRWGTPWT